MCPKHQRSVSLALAVQSRTLSFVCKMARSAWHTAKAVVQVAVWLCAVLLTIESEQLCAHSGCTHPPFALRVSLYVNVIAAISGRVVLTLVFDVNAAACGKWVGCWHVSRESWV